MSKFVDECVVFFVTSTEVDNQCFGQKNSTHLLYFKNLLVFEGQTDRHIGPYFDQKIDPSVSANYVQT